MRQSKYDEALSYLKQSLALSETLGTTIYQADIHDNLCGTLRGMGKYTAAVEHGYRSIALYEQEERLTGKAEAWNNLGDVYLEMGEFDKAVASFRHAYQIAETIGLRFQAVEALLRMGDAWVGQEQYPKAKEVGIDTLARANDIDSLSLQYQSYFLLFKAAQAMGDLAEALAHHIQYHKFREVVFNQEADARKSALEAVYQVRQAQQETEIYQLKSVELEREVAERNRIAAELQQQNDELQAFAHTVAHDLKSPIALMVGFAEVLQGDVTALAPDMMAQIVQSIASGGHKAAQIIDELLLLAGVRSQQVMPELVDITAVTADAIYQLKTEIEARQGTIVQTNTFPLAVGYAPWIEQVWKNYISNGLKYGGTPPVLTLGFTENVAGMTRFWVQDNGPGLTSTEQARLFTEFTRLAHDRANGHGLGLAIVRRIMEKLNGRVGVESVPGEGCLFYFDLPGEGG